MGEIEARLDRVAPPRDFRGALARPGDVALIAECKRRSPGAGEIRPGLHPAALTRGYESAGAAAISVLTDVEYFGGSMDDLASVHDAVDLPILRKDFTLDTAHVIEARAGGADAVLLIARILSDDELARLQVAATALGIPTDATQTVLLPVGYTRDAVLRPAKRLPPREVTYWNRWGRGRDSGS